MKLGDGQLVAKGALGQVGDALEVSLRATEIGPLAKLAGVDLAGGVQAQANLAGTFAEPTLQRKGHGDAPRHRHQGEIRGGRCHALRRRGPRIASSIEARPHARRAPARGLRGRLRSEGQVALLEREDRVARAHRPRRLCARRARDARRLGRARRAGRGARARRLGRSRASRRFAGRRRCSTSSRRATACGCRTSRAACASTTCRAPTSWSRATVTIHAADTLNAAVNLQARLGRRARGRAAAWRSGVREMVLKADVVNDRASASLAARRRSHRTHPRRRHGSRRARVNRAGPSPRRDPVDARVVLEETNLEQFAPWLGTDAKLGGKVNAQVTVSGTGADPQFGGSLRAENCRGARAPERFRARRRPGGAAAHGAFARDRAALGHDALASVGGRARAHPQPFGSVPAAARSRADGAIDLAARTGSIRVKLDQVPVTQIETRFLSLSGEARLDAMTTGFGVTGAFKADAGWVGALAKALPSVSEDVVVRAQDADRGSAGRKPSSSTLPWRLGTGSTSRAAGSTRASRARLRLTGTPGAGLKATGSIRAVGGKYDAYGQQLAIERGVITFAGPDRQSAAERARAAQGLAGGGRRRGAGHDHAAAACGWCRRPTCPSPRSSRGSILGRGAADSILGDSGLMLAAARALLAQHAGIGPHAQARLRRHPHRALGCEQRPGRAAAEHGRGPHRHALGGGRGQRRASASTTRCTSATSRGSRTPRARCASPGRSRASSRSCCAPATCRAWTLVYRWSFK